MHHLDDAPDFGLEDAEGIGIGQHQSGHFASHLALERGQIDAAPAVGLQIPHLVSRGRDAGRVGAVSRIWDQYVTARVTAFFKACPDHQQAGELALRSRRRLQRNGVHAGDLKQGALSIG